MQRVGVRFGKAFLFLVLAAATAGVRGQDAEMPRVRLSLPPVRVALVGVVKAQLAALRAQDWARAYGYAANSFQSVVTPRAFVTLITRNYPVLVENTGADFGIPSDNGLLAVVPVRVFSRDASESYQWLLVKEGDRWRVSGVVPQRVRDGA